MEEESGDADAVGLWSRCGRGSRGAGDETDACTLGDGPSTMAESDDLRTGEAEWGRCSVGAGNIESSRGCILGGGEGLSCARDILVAKAEAGSRSMSS